MEKEVVWRPFASGERWNPMDDLKKRLSFHGILRFRFDGFVPAEEIE